jgi:hypothetical protein
MKVFASAFSQATEVIWLADENVTPVSGSVMTVPVGTPAVVVAAVAVAGGLAWEIVTAGVADVSLAVGEAEVRVGDAEEVPVSGVRTPFGSVPHALSATSRNTGRRRIFTGRMVAGDGGFRTQGCVRP